MPYRNEVQPLNLFGDYVAGRQAAIGQQAGQQQNALRGIQVQQAQNVNALSQNPNATPEQYARAGDPQTGMALQSMNQQGQVDKMQAVQQLGSLAAKALTITDPAQRKGFLAQAQQVYAPAFQALGADLSQFPQMLAMPDADLEQKLKQVAQFASPQKPIEVAAGASLVTPNSSGGYNAAFTAPAKPSEGPSAIREYEYAKGQGYKGSFQQWETDMKRAGATSINLGSQGLSTPPTGYARPDPLKPGLIVEPGGPADLKANPKPPGEADKKAAVMFGSMVNAENQLKDLKGVDTANIGQAALGSTSVTRVAQSDAFKKYEAAGLRWAANLLYMKSGATATPDEIRSTWKQYFPQPGEGEEVKVQKAEARNQEMQTVAQTYGLDASKIPALQKAQAGSNVRQFATEAEAAAAGLKSGTRVIIGGVPGTWQ
jgi:hypothetical protein